MPDRRPAEASSVPSVHSCAHLGTHTIPHSASDPTQLTSTLSSTTTIDQIPHSPTESDRESCNHQPPKQSSMSPPSLSPSEQQAFSSLRPTGSSQQPQASTQHHTVNQHANSKHDSESNHSSIRSLRSSASAIKNLPSTVTETLTTTVGAPARTLNSIKNKLQSPSTSQKSKSDIPNSLGRLEHDMQQNQHAPGNLQQSPSLTTTHEALPAQSSSFTSLFKTRSKRSKKQLPALMQRAPQRSISASANQADIDMQDEEEDHVVQQRIYDQQKRLEELDEAQTMGLLRTQQEAGLEPIQCPDQPTKPSWLVALPLFGDGAGSAQQRGDAQGEQACSSRTSSFRRGSSRRRAKADESDTDNRTHTGGIRRSNSEKLPEPRDCSPPVTRSASTSRAAHTRVRSQATPRRRNSTGLHLPRRHSTTWTSKLRTRIPIKEFPLQGSGRESEFNQECPLWARQPWKYMYFSYFGLSVGLYHLPRWAISSILPSHRGRPDWSWKKATMVKLFRHGTKLTFRTRTNLGRDLQKEVPHSKTVRCKFTWVNPVAHDDVRGELRRAMQVQKVMPQRTCGFWYGEVGKQHHAASDSCRARKHASGPSSTNASSTPNQERECKGEECERVDAMHESAASLRAVSQSSHGSSGVEAKRGVGRSAEPGEKVLYHLHGGAYWIGTAHEKDVTAAVNTESLRYMAEIYRAREAANGQTWSRSTSSSTSSSSSASNSCSAGARSTSAGKLLRSFSLDYRLCVPGRPRAGSYPAALLDALSGYLYLVRELNFSPENIIIAGDSAGGNLALALCRYLRDEGPSIAEQPGALLLMSPWVDVSRSHSGPTGAPNLDSTVYLNQDSDIISNMLAFRNTAVSAFLGDLPARETYRNPYISPVSLQLPLERGGEGPHWGFHGFPKKIYITTGSAEISYDQHLTLAHRLAEGTIKARPVYAGDRLSAGCNAREMAERRARPRPKEILDADQAQIGETPADELQGMQLGVEPERGEQFATKVVDGEPRPGNTRRGLHSRDTTLLGENGEATNDGTLEPAPQPSQASSAAAAAAKTRLHAVPPPEPAEKEDRQVILDEVKDAVHDYLLFKWFEPERSSTWRRIAQWIDGV